MKFSTFLLLMAVLVVVLAFDTAGNAGDSAPKPSVESEAPPSPIVQRIRERTVTITPSKVERTAEECGPAGCRTVSRSSVIERQPAASRIRSRGGLFQRLRERRSRSVSVSRSLGCSK